MSKHTPGPWEILNSGDIFGPAGGNSGDGVMADASDGWQIAEVGHYLTFVDNDLVELGDEVREANMRLIAAAPELLESLEYAVKQVPELGTVPGIAAAIAKAKGES